MGNIPKKLVDSVEHCLQSEKIYEYLGEYYGVFWRAMIVLALLNGRWVLQRHCTYGKSLDA